MDSIKDTEYLVINAWNEWSEGMMLEPTVENKYKYFSEEYFCAIGNKYKVRMCLRIMQIIV